MKKAALLLLVLAVAAPAEAKTKPALLGWFVGQVMKASGGKANPQTVNALLKAKLGIE